MNRHLLLTLIACLLTACSYTEDKSTGAGHYAYLADSKTLYAINLNIENPKKVAINQFQDLPDIPLSQDGPNIHNGSQIVPATPVVKEYVLAQNGPLPAKNRGLIYVDNHHFWGLEFNVDKLVRPRQISKEYIDNLCAATVIHDELYYRVGQAGNSLSGGCSLDSLSGWKKVNLDTKANEAATTVMLPSNNLQPYSLAGAVLYNPAIRQKLFLQGTSQGVVGIFDDAFAQKGSISELKSIDENHPISNQNGVYLLSAVNLQDEFGFYLFDVNSKQLTPIPNVIAYPSTAKWSEYLNAFVVITRSPSLTTFSLLKINTLGQTEQLVTLPEGYKLDGFKVGSTSIVYFSYSDSAGAAYELNLKTNPISVHKLYDSLWSGNPEPEIEGWVSFQNELCLSQTPASPLDYCASLVRGEDGFKVEIPSASWVYEFVPSDMKRSNYLVVNTAAAKQTPKVNLAVKQQPAGTFKTLIDLKLTQLPIYSEVYSGDHRNDLFTYSISNDQRHVILIDKVAQKASEITTSSDERWLRGFGETYFAR